MNKYLLKMTDDGQVIGRVLNDEVVVINFNTGMYFSLSGAGCDIWPWLGAGITLEELGDRLTARYGEAPEVIRADAAALIKELLAAGLIQQVEGAALATENTPPAPSTGVYKRGELKQFDDLADSFAVDPPLVIGS